MLSIPKHTSKFSAIVPKIIIGFASVLLVGGVYILSIVLSPAIAPIIVNKPIDVQSLPSPKPQDNRLIIPKIGVDIKYAPGQESLNKGAEWRFPERGTPSGSGNFIIAAHRLTIQPTPKATIEKSPFYNIDKLGIGDKIIADYLGERYAYNITKIFNVLPTQTEIEAPSENPKMTLYSCDITGSATGRIVIIADPIGKVELSKSDSTKS